MSVRVHRVLRRSAAAAGDRRAGLSARDLHLHHVDRAGDVLLEGGDQLRLLVAADVHLRLVGHEPFAAHRHAPHPLGEPADHGPAAGVELDRRRSGRRIEGEVEQLDGRARDRRPLPFRLDFEGRRSLPDLGLGHRTGEAGEEGEERSDPQDGPQDVIRGRHGECLLESNSTMESMGNAPRSRSSSLSSFPRPARPGRLRLAAGPERPAAPWRSGSRRRPGSGAPRPLRAASRPGSGACRSTPAGRRSTSSTAGSRGIRRPITRWSAWTWAHATSSSAPTR